MLEKWRGAKTEETNKLVSSKKSTLKVYIFVLVSHLQQLVKLEKDPYSHTSISPVAFGYCQLGFLISQLQSSHFACFILMMAAFFRVFKA